MDYLNHINIMDQVMRYFVGLTLLVLSYFCLFRTSKFQDFNLTYYLRHSLIKFTSIENYLRSRAQFYNIKFCGIISLIMALAILFLVE